MVGLKPSNWFYGDPPVADGNYFINAFIEYTPYQFDAWYYDLGTDAPDCRSLGEITLTYWQTYLSPVCNGIGATIKVSSQC